MATKIHQKRNIFKKFIGQWRFMESLNSKKYLLLFVIFHLVTASPAAFGQTGSLNITAYPIDAVPGMGLSEAMTSKVSKPIVLWSNAAPGERGEIGTEQDKTKPGDKLVGGKRVVRLSNVSSPSMTLYFPPPEKNTGAAVVVCPGGGYGILGMDLEGTEVCQWLNSIGVTAGLLKYRVPVRKGLERYTAPLQDAQRALRLMRFHAGEWHIDPQRIGIMGFSAGGHLSAVASTHFEQRSYHPADEADQTSCRPDFTMLIYPAYLVQKEGPSLASELTVTSNTPPTFLIQSEDDPIHVENSLFYYLALKQAGVPAEMHLFASGGHGYGLRPLNKTAMAWPTLAEEWLRGLRILEVENPESQAILKKGRLNHKGSI